MDTGSGRTEYVVALDLGNEKIACLIAELRGEELTVVGRASAPSFGVRHGEVTDLTRAADSAAIAVSQAAGSCSVVAHSAFACIAGADLKTETASGTVEVPSRRRQVSPGDKRRLMEEARDRFEIPEDRILVSSRPLRWSLDEMACVDDPVGLTGRRLRIELAVMTAKRDRIDDLRALMHKAGLYLEGILPEPEASAAGCLSDDERELGALVVSVGAGVTHAGIVPGKRNGCVEISRAWPGGSRDWTEALMSRFRISQACAERVKRQIADLRHAEGPVDGAAPEPIEVSTLDGQGTRRVSPVEIAGELRGQAISSLERVREFCRERSFHPAQAAGVILTGGGASLKGLLPVAAKVFGTPCRLGVPRLRGLADLNDPSLTSAAGALACGARQRFGRKGGLFDRALGQLRRVAAAF